MVAVTDLAGLAASTVPIAALTRDVGSEANLEDRTQLLRTEIAVAGLASPQATLELAVVFHHAVRGDYDQVLAAIAGLRDLTHDGDYAYYVDIAHIMADLPLSHPSPTRWLDGPEPTRTRWRSLVTARRIHWRTTR